jgi:hypothetical protein
MILTTKAGTQPQATQVSAQATAGFTCGQRATISVFTSDDPHGRLQRGCGPSKPEKHDNAAQDGGDDGHGAD